MNNEIAIRVVNLSKKYTISGSNERISLTEGFKSIFKQKPAQIEEFYALKDINFEIKKGEAVGIIGRNGAGKSTLLKILSRVTEPSEGRVEIYGSVASVLEVGMGFHPELTGRENVYLSGSMLGMQKKHIESKFDEIVAFAGVEKFIDTPVKHYSSGMYVRLAFSVVANIDADIMLFDEVLSVGDLAFQMKCGKKIKELIDKEKTVLLVSHNVNDIQHLCNNVIYMDRGVIEKRGSIEVVKKYFEDSYEDVRIINNETSGKEECKKHFPNILCKEWSSEEAPGDDSIKLKKIYVQNLSNPGSDCFFSDDNIAICFEYEKMDDYNFYDFGLVLSYMNNAIAGYQTMHSEIDITKRIEKGLYTAKAILKKDFFNETIIDMGFSITKNNHKLLFYDFNLLRIKIVLTIKEHEITYFNNINKFFGPLRPKIEWHINRF